MCTDCGCAPPQPEHDHKHDHASRKIRVEENLLAKNQRLAMGNRASFAAHQLFVLNLVSSPGSGKTSIL